MSIIDLLKKLNKNENKALGDSSEHSQAESIAKDEKKDGLHVEYPKDGQLLKDEKKDGLHVVYPKDGQLKVKCTYKDGKPVDGPYEDEEYPKNGQLLKVAEYGKGGR